MSKTIAEQLHIKPHTTVWVSDPAQVKLLTPMPDGVRETDVLATASTAVLFVGDAADAREQMAEHAADAAKPAAFWVAYQGDHEPITAVFGKPEEQVTLDPTWSAIRYEPSAS
jgi:hypothetical protein